MLGGGDVFATLQSLMSWTGGPVNWDLAQKVAGEAARSGDRPVTDAERREVAEACRLADLWLDAVTTLPAGGGEARAWSRTGWLESTLPAWKQLVDPVAGARGRGHGPGAGEGHGRGRRARRARGAAARGRGDARRPRPGRARRRAAGRHAAGRRLRLRRAGRAGARRAGRRGRQRHRGRPAARRARPAGAAARRRRRLRRGPGRPARPGAPLPGPARVRPPAAVRPRAVAARPTCSTPSTPTPAASTSTCRRSSRPSAASTRATPRACSGPWATGLFDTAPTPAQQAALDRLETALALVEGWVDAVVDAAAGGTLPAAVQLRETVRRRRATGGPAEQTFQALVGLQLRPKRLREAAALWSAVAEARGTEGRDALWGHPDLLPGPSDLDDPQAFVRARRRRRLRHRLGRRPGRARRRPGRRRSAAAQARSRARPARAVAAGGVTSRP